MKQIKLSSAIVYLKTFDVVREWDSTFPCYRKDNYIMSHFNGLGALKAVLIIGTDYRKIDNTLYRY